MGVYTRQNPAETALNMKIPRKRTHTSHFHQPLTRIIDIRAVKFFQKFQSSDNHICNLFSKKAEIGVKNIFSQYESQIHNVYDLKKL